MLRVAARQFKRLSHLALTPATGFILQGFLPGTSARRRLHHSLPRPGWRGSTKDGQHRMLDQLQPSTAPDFISPTGLRVRQDLYDEDYSDEDYEQMLSMYEGTMAQIVEGEIVKSKVLRVTDNAVILDVGFKSEGSVPLDEFKDPQSLKEGDEVEVFLEHLEDQEGAVVLSKKKADFMRVWEKIRVAHESDQPVEGTLVKKIKGGVVVNLMGVDAFLPGSQIALRRVPNIDELLGQTYEFKIIKLNKRRRNIVVSRRVILENERAHKREHLMKELAVGQVRKGVVKNITDFGAFIDLGGVDGLLHITDMSYGRVSHPTEMVADRQGSRGQDPRHRLAARAHQPRHEAAAVLSRGRTSPPSIRSAPGSRARSSRSPTTARSSRSSRASRAWCTSPR